jgi:hypothetical protein
MLRDVKPNPGNPGTEQPGQASAGAGGGSLRVFTCACGKEQASSLCGLKLIPIKWRHLVPPRRIELVEITSPHQGATRRVMQTVRWLLGYSRGVLKKFELQV